MSALLRSPGGILSDEEECGAVFESTAADIGGLLHPQRFRAPIQEISVIAPATDPQTPTKEALQTKTLLDRTVSRDEATEKLKVFLRIRPLTETEKERGEEQGCVCVQNEDTLLLTAPKDSHNMKTAERGIVQSVHKFNFTQIFGSQTSQQDVYDQTMREMVRDVLRGENRLLYTYGVTNSGKTYTIQGTAGEAGLLPRALVSVFYKTSGRLYTATDLKPVLSQEVRRLDVSEVCAEESKRDALLKEDTTRLRGGTSCSWDSGIGGLSAVTRLEDSDTVCLEADPLSLSGGDDLEPGLQYSIWVSFYEIYNEFLYDLLEALPTQQTRKRATLRLSDDKYGNPYVKDLTWVQVRSAEEAWKVLKVGRRNQSFASTHLNHNSSRSHSIFTIRVLHIDPQMEMGQGTRISELSVCDLAGSERCKNQQNGERMKEANNINTSLLTLGRCISALRHNQANKSRAPQVVPFRDSKLTRVLQSFFCGHGRSCMVVNINPCASTYDETLQALKFSAIATQLVHGPATKTRVAYILSLLREQNAHTADITLEEDDEEEESDDEGDLTMFDPEELLKAINILKREVLRQRQEKVNLEARVREEVCTEMMEIINRMQDDFSETLERERHLNEERCENKISNLKTSLKKYYSQELEERDEHIRELMAALNEKNTTSAAPIFPPLDTEGLRRSKRLASTHIQHTGHEAAELEQCKTELDLCKAELDQCKAELDLRRTELRLKTLELKRCQEQPTISSSTCSLTSAADRKLEEGQRNLRQLRADLHLLGLKLQSGERACCRNTDGEKLRMALSSADTTLAKQGQMLVELHTSLQLVKAEMRHKDERLAQLQLQCPPAPSSTTPSSCKRRGCGENQPPEKRPLLRSLFTRTPSKTPQWNSATTPYARVLRSRQPSPPPSPALVRRVKY
uniref:Kinesin-like protein n=1 Tax=Astyanax mexicanus TaxID=7994 RepID=W5KMB2_ASTMX